jgi:hypothetical protein
VEDQAPVRGQHSSDPVQRASEIPRIVRKVNVLATVSALSSGRGIRDLEDVALGFGKQLAAPRSDRRGVAEPAHERGVNNVPIEAHRSWDGTGEASPGHFVTTYQLFWMSCARRCVVIERKPAFCRYSRVFSSPHMAPRPSPPCASDTVMQCMHEMA